MIFYSLLYIVEDHKKCKTFSKDQQHLHTRPVRQYKDITFSNILQIIFLLLILSRVFYLSSCCTIMSVTEAAIPIFKFMSLESLYIYCLKRK